ncbi:MAG: hypothetical protein Q9P14_11655 [candidate division KSB1 bacterium]|nr:hypothetical protein [candidate division KSB1 bacterium]
MFHRSLGILQPDCLIPFEKLHLRKRLQIFDALDGNGCRNAVDVFVLKSYLAAHCLNFLHDWTIRFVDGNQHVHGIIACLELAGKRKRQAKKKDNRAQEKRIPLHISSLHLGFTT